MLERLRNLFRSRWKKYLEEEVARLRAENEQLRAENRGLVNSLLGTVGLPPMTEQEKAPTVKVRRRSLHQIQRETERETTLQMRQREEMLRKPDEPQAAA